MNPQHPAGNNQRLCSFLVSIYQNGLGHSHTTGSSKCGCTNLNFAKLAKSTRIVQQCCLVFLLVVPPVLQANLSDGQGIIQVCFRVEMLEALSCVRIIGMPIDFKLVSEFKRNLKSVEAWKRSTRSIAYESCNVECLNINGL